MIPKTFNYDRLVKSEDLNHHNTLFAGRCAEWFVEAGFIAVASLLPAHKVVCLKIHGLLFKEPLKSGDIARFKSKIVFAGRSSLIVFVSLSESKQEDPILEGFITFVYIDDDGRAQPHGLTIELSDPEDITLSQRAAALR